MFYPSYNDDFWQTTKLFTSIIECCCIRIEHSGATLFICISIKHFKGHNLKMREMMIAKRYRRVYHKIKRGKKRQAREVNALRRKKAKLAAESVE